MRRILLAGLAALLALGRAEAQTFATYSTSGGTVPATVILCPTSSGSTSSAVCSFGGGGGGGNVVITDPVTPSHQATVNSSGQLQVSGGLTFSGSIPAGTNNIGGVELIDSGGTNKASISSGGAVKIDGSAVTQPISATSLPLPTSAATAANQTNVQSAVGTSATTALTIQGSASGVAIPVTIGGTTGVNISNFGGNPVQTGTGASGVGIPRVTVSNDSTLAPTAFGTVTWASVTTSSTIGNFVSALASSGSRNGCTIQNPNGAAGKLRIFVGTTGTTHSQYFEIPIGGNFNCNPVGNQVLTQNIDVAADTAGQTAVVASW